MVRQLNIDGDDQADRAAHGGEHRAVFVYQLEAYRYWEGELDRDDFAFGQFGENFTVEGLPDDEVCIGDRYRIGEAVFEVTQPRVTCFRLGLRMAEPRMPSLVVAHHRPGFYFRVLQEGRVQAGDAIERVLSGPGATDGRRCRRAALPAPQVTERAGAGAAGAGVERWMEGLVPGAARAGREARRASGARVAGLRTARRDRGAARERCDRLVHAGGRGRGGGRCVLRAARAVPVGPAAPEPWSGGDPQLLDVAARPRRTIPDQRQARAAGDRFPVHADPGPGR